MALPDTTFPHLTLIRQTDAEVVLARALADRGIEVERGTELVEVRDGPGGTRAVLRSPGGTEEALFDFVAGCDGPASTVRVQAGIAWPGRPYAVEAVLADVELDAELATGAAHVAAGRRGLLFVFPLGERTTWRLLATRPARAGPAPFGQFGPRSPPLSCRRSWTRRAWAGRSPALPGPRGSGCSTALPNGSATGGCAWPGTPPTPTPRPPARE
jgi:2-polyprenyl-6-methoxyphenol hydroxylase-like FAD-dependent oxidoreductase